MNGTLAWTGMVAKQQRRWLLLAAIAAALVCAMTLAVVISSRGGATSRPTAPATPAVAAISAADDSLPIGPNGQGVPATDSAIAPLPGQDDTLR